MTSHGSTVPPVAFIVPTYNAEKHLAMCLASIRMQDYHEGAVEVVVVDGGSTDKTVEIAHSFDVNVVSNPRRDAQIGKAVGLAYVRSNPEFVVLMDADNEIVESSWLTTMVWLLQKEPQAFGADADFIVKPGNPAINRVSILMQTGDPFVRQFSNLRRNSMIRRKDGYELLEIKPGRYPAFGANGFMWRTKVLLPYLESRDSFDESDLSARIVADGHRVVVFSKGKGIYHHHVRTLGEYIRKRIRNGKEFIERAKRKQENAKEPVWVKRYSLWELALAALYCATFIGPTIEAVRGCRRDKDAAWLLFPLLAFLAVAVYVCVWVFYHPRDSRPQAERAVPKGS